MRRLVLVRALVLGAAAMLGCTAAPSLFLSSGQSEVDYYRKTVNWMPGAYAPIRNAWDSTNAMQLERAFCLDVVALSEKGSGDTSFFVVRATPATVKWATQVQMLYEPCAGKASIHIHPPTLCNITDKDNNGIYEVDTSSCYLTDPEDYVCLPSTGDLIMLDRRQGHFDMLQCDRDRATLYYYTKWKLEKILPGRLVRIDTMPSREKR
jgi:hypothetical protein